MAVAVVAATIAVAAVGVVRGAAVDSTGPGIFLGEAGDAPGADVASSAVPEQAALSWSTMLLSKDGVDDTWAVTAT